MSFADIKATTRRNVHKEFAVPTNYYAPGSTTPIALSARLHGKLVQGGDLSGQGYSVIIENVTRLVFNREELATMNVSPANGSTVHFLDYDVWVTLDTRDPYDGPINERWALAPGSPV
jgi:hypothetical protein